MHRLRALGVLGIVCALSLRCDCCRCAHDHDQPTSSSARASKSASYAGVGDPCSDDFTDDERWGCGGYAEHETCAEGLSCCPPTEPTASGESRYRCVASLRCGTADPGGSCASHRDCPASYQCVGHVCRADVGRRCSRDRECVTDHCAGNVCAYPPEPDAGLAPWPTDAGADVDDAADGTDRVTGGDPLLTDGAADSMADAGAAP